MGMSDCPKCWDTPCECGYKYESWSAKRLTTFILMLLGILKKKVGKGEA